MAFNKLNSVESYIIQRLSGINLNDSALREHNLLPLLQVFLPLSNYRPRAPLGH